MCIALPKRIVKYDPDLKLVEVDFNGEIIQARTDLIEFMPENGYAIIQSGMVIKVMTAAEAKESIDLWDEMNKTSQ